MGSAIPVRNVYYLLCYAWDCLRERGFADVATAGTTELADLFARLLITGTNRLRRRGLERGYREQCQELGAIRGRINTWETVTRLLDRHGKASCEYDELSIDTPQNRAVKATISLLAVLPEVDRSNRQELRRLARELSEIPDVSLNRSLFRTVRLHANNRHYSFLMHLARLVLECAIPDEKGSGYRFRDFLRDRHQMARLFEAFIFNFLRTERSDLAISRDQLRWDASSEDDSALAYLPSMRTDVTVRAPGRTVIIDAKYYEQSLQEHFDHKTIHSANLYQLVSYLRNLEVEDGSDAVAEAMLIYPVVDAPIKLTYQIQGHKVGIFTLNLAQEWKDIEQDLVKLV